MAAGAGTLTQVLQELAEVGWTGNFAITDDALVRCSGCRTESVPTAMGVDGLRRLEGASDPDDMVAVVSLTCPECETRGVVVAKYGPTSGPADAEALMAFDDAPAP